MRITRSLLGLAATVTTVLASVLAAGTAQAAPVPHGSSGGQVMTMPAAPEGAHPASLLAVAPTVSPAVRTAYAGAGGGVYCQSGYFCASVWDPTAGQFKIFFFYSCTRYTLSNWIDWAEAQNSQTEGATARLYGFGGGVLQTIPADNAVYAVNWTPVYSIRNC
ncbi:hypothetical protein ACIRVK_31645 [Streptomyces sp. NPDC101152]|uniref:hypothetical protein n=1 Tax=Streptomyces sp. NPDC101152 TaxID=3366116 RepID=UPI003811311F